MNTAPYDRKWETVGKLIDAEQMEKAVKAAGHLFKSNQCASWEATKQLARLRPVIVEMKRQGKF